MISRRATALLVVFGVFLGALLIASRRLEIACLDGVSGHRVNLSKGVPDAFEHAGDAQGGGEKPVSGPTAAPPDDVSSRKPPIALSDRPKGTPEPECALFPDTSKILLVMKTGASEAFAKVPTQILTNLKCLPEFLIFGDMDQEIAGYKIRDSLDRVLDSVRTNNRDFDIYFRQRQCVVDQDSCNEYFNIAREGWDLDKYKNVHIAEKTFGMRPYYDWYLFVDADTYVAWPTMVQWLDKLDHTEPMYFGSVAMLDGFRFGHGGSGYVVSNAAMHDFFGGRNNVANRWDEATIGQCCGDLMFAKALRETTGIGVNDTWPTINGEKPSTIPYSDHAWCQPISTMHHIGSEELSNLYAFERKRNFTFPMRIRDVYHQFVAPHLVPTRLDWDNLSDDVYYLNTSSNLLSYKQLSRAKTNGLSPLEKTAYLSFDNCRQACEADMGCLQYRFYHGICGFGRKIKLGYPKPKNDDVLYKWMSGWNVDKIQAWVQEHDDCGDAIKWPLVQT